MQSQVQQLLAGLAHSLQAQTNPQLPTLPSGWSIVGPAQPSALHQQAALPADGSWASLTANQAGQQAPASTTVRAESGVPAEAATPPLLPQPSTPAPGHAVDQGTVQCEPPAEGLTSDTMSIDPVALRSEAAAPKGTAGKATSTQQLAQPSAGDASVKAPEAACSSQPAAPPVSLEACGGLGCSSGTISIDIAGLRSQAPAVCSSTTISVDIVGLASQVPAQLPAPSALGTDTGYPPAEGAPQQADTQQADMPQAEPQHVAAEATVEIVPGTPPADHADPAPGQCHTAEARQAHQAASAPLPSAAFARSIRRRRGASPAASQCRADSAPLALPKVSKCQTVGELQEVSAPAPLSAAVVAPIAEAEAETVYASAQSTMSTPALVSAVPPASEMCSSPPGTAPAAHCAAATAAAADAEAVSHRQGSQGRSAQQHAALQTQPPDETHIVREAQHMGGAPQKRQRSGEDEGSRKVARLEKALKQINADASSLLSGCGGSSLQAAVTRQQSRRRQPGMMLRGGQITHQAAVPALPGRTLNPLPEVEALLEIAATRVQLEGPRPGSMSASMGCQGRSGGGGGVSGQPAQPGAAEEQRAVPAEPPAEGRGPLQMPVTAAAAQAGPAQHAQPARPAVKGMRGSRELNTLLQAAATMPTRSTSAMPLCNLAAGRTRAHTEVQPTISGALPHMSAAENPEPPRLRAALGPRKVKALSAAMRQSDCTSGQPEHIPSRRRAHSMVHFTGAADASDKAASCPPESCKSKPVSGLRELLALGASLITSNHMPDHFQQASGRTRAQSAEQPGAAGQAPDQPAMKPSQPSSTKPARGRRGVQALRVQLPCTRAVSCRQGPRHAAEPTKPETLKGRRDPNAHLCMGPPSSAPSAGRQDSGRAHPRRKAMRGLRELLALRSDAPSSACMAHPAKRSKQQPVRGLNRLGEIDAGIPSADMTSGQQSVPQALQSKLASAVRLPTRSSAHVTASCTRKLNAQSGGQDGRRILAAGHVDGARHKDSAACRTRGGKAGHCVPSDGVPIGRCTRAWGHVSLPRPSESSKRLSSANNSPIQRQLQRPAPSGKHFTAAPQRMHNVLLGLEILHRLGRFMGRTAI